MDNANEYSDLWPLTCIPFPVSCGVCGQAPCICSLADDGGGYVGDDFTQLVDQAEARDRKANR